MRAWSHIEEIEKAGGMTKAIAMGLPKRRIEEAAARAQAKIDSGARAIVGVNCHQDSDEDEISVLKVETKKVLETQLKRLEALKKARDARKTEEALGRLREGAKGGGNLLALSVEAARAEATVGEMSYALEEVFGRHQPRLEMVKGVYGSASDNEKNALRRAQKKVKDFQEMTGKRPKILVAKIGQDGHDRGQKVVATAYADAGFEVEVGTLFQTPEEVARQAVEAGVHIVGVSSLAGGHSELLPALVKALEKRKEGRVMVVLGGVVPKGDYQTLKEAGVEEIYPPGTIIGESICDLVDKLHARHNIL